jgi:hypothetical protein
MGKQKRLRKKQIESRTALSQKNIVEFAMEQSKRVKDRNRSLQSTVLRTDPKLLATVAYIPKLK